jgi:sterol desaturase/sphingolipid hydroxylase (fatty acid hydroxylase superfamily)
MEAHLLTWLKQAAAEGLRYTLFAGGTFLVFWVIFRKKMSARLIQKKFPASSHIRREIGYSILTIMIFAANGVAITYLNLHGMGSVYTDPGKFGLFYFVLSFPLSVFLHNTWFYWTHRWMHQPSIYKHVHKVHHLSTNPSPWAAYSFHPLEALVQAGIGWIHTVLIPMPVHALVFFGIFTISYNVMGHLSMEIFPKGMSSKRWFFWHNTPTHHNMHHRFFNCHYSLYFNIWDRLMGTMHPDYDKHFDSAAFDPAKVVAGNKTPA